MSRLRSAAAALALALAAAPAAHAKPWVTRWYPFEIVANRIHVPVKLAGADTTAIFDTGANVAFVDREFAEAHGVRVVSSRTVQLVGANSTRTVPLASHVPIELFGASIPLRDVPAGKLGPAKLIIGLNVLRSFILQIDYASSRIRFLSHDAIALDELANVEMRRERESGLPAVRASVDGKPVWLMLDTGMSGPLRLTTSFVEGRGWEKTGETPTFDVHGKQRDAEVYRVPLLQLGPYDLRGVRAAVSRQGHVRREDRRGDAYGVRTAGILGAEVLRKFLLTLDLKERRLHLEPAAQSTAPAEDAELPSLEAS